MQVHIKQIRVETAAFRTVQERAIRKWQRAGGSWEPSGQGPEEPLALGRLCWSREGTSKTPAHSVTL